MTYQVCILDTQDIYRVLFSSLDGETALAWYDARIAEDFATVYSTTENTFTMSIMCFGLDYVDMTSTQKTNIDVMCADTVQFLLAVCF